jgi:hypothetical protein
MILRPNAWKSKIATNLTEPACQYFTDAMLLLSCFNCGLLVQKNSGISVHFSTAKF